MMRVGVLEGGVECLLGDTDNHGDRYPHKRNENPHLPHQAISPAQKLFISVHGTPTPPDDRRL